MITGRFSLEVALQGRGLSGPGKRLELRSKEPFQIVVAQKRGNVPMVGAIVFVGEVPIYGSPDSGLALPASHFTSLHGWPIDGELVPFEAGAYPEEYGEVFHQIPIPTPITAFFFDSIDRGDPRPNMSPEQKFLFRTIPGTLTLRLIRKGVSIAQKPFLRCDHPSAVLTAWVNVI